MDEQIKIQHREILERFNKIIWTHKIQLCQANIYLEEKKHQNKIMSILSTLVSASAITNFAKLVSEEYIVPVVAVLSILLTYCTYKYKSENLDKKAAENERFASILHNLRNKYAGLLSDIKAGLYNKDEISKRRIQLEELEDIIYSGLVPYTSSKAVDAATIAIKDKQESTTTDEEIEKIVSSNLQL